MQVYLYEPWRSWYKKIMDKKPAPSFFIPTRPFTPIDSLNRRAAAVGSPNYAMISANVNYNGHAVTLDWNDYRRYYIAQYWWAGRNVIARGEFAQCLRAVINEFNRGALGSSATVRPRADDEEAIALCRSTEPCLSG